MIARGRGTSCRDTERRCSIPDGQKRHFLHSVMHNIIPTDSANISVRNLSLVTFYKACRIRGRMFETYSWLLAGAQGSLRFRGTLGWKRCSTTYTW